MNKTPEFLDAQEARLDQTVVPLDPEAFDAFQAALECAPRVDDNPRLMALLRQEKRWDAGQ